MREVTPFVREQILEGKKSDRERRDVVRVGGRGGADGRSVVTKYKTVTIDSTCRDVGAGKQGRDFRVLCSQNTLKSLRTLRSHVHLLAKESRTNGDMETHKQAYHIIVAE